MALDALLAWYAKIRKQQVEEGIVRLSLWTCTILFFASITWVFSMKLMDDPGYFVLETWGPWGGPPQDNRSNLTTGRLITVDYSNDTKLQQQGTATLLNFNGSVDGNAQRDEGSATESVLKTQAREDVLEDGQFIQHTTVRGKKAVDRFRAHISCLSDAGRWVYDPNPRKLPWLAVKEYDWVTFCDRQHIRKRNGGITGEKADVIALSNGTVGGNWSVREELKWVWRTNDSSCPWHPMDRDDFCRRVGANRNILVVGDSINHEISVAIQNALSMNSSSVVTRKLWPSEEVCTDILPGSGGDGKALPGFRVHFVRNDYLSLVGNRTRIGRNIQEPWMATLERENIQILILNRGAHYQDDGAFTRGLRATFSFLQAQHPNLLVIYRNTPSGHVNCSHFHSPIDKPETGAPPSFHWEDFDQQNLIAKSLVEEFHYIYVDVARAIGMRPEGHMNDHDCLHYCQPGPLDVIVEMIYNVLLLL